MRFQETATHALSASYVRNNWFDQEPSLRFATKVVNRSEVLSTTLEKYGHLYHFKASDDQLDHDGEEEEVSVTESETYENGYAEETAYMDEAEDVEEPESTGEAPNGHIDLRFTPDHDELDEILYNKKTMSKVIAGNTMRWLTKVYKDSRGFELGTFDSSLLAMAMKTQSSKWEEIALGYISDIVSMAHTFIKKLLQLSCPTSRIRSGIMFILMDGLMVKYKAAFDHARFLLYTERMGTPATLNHYFNDNLEKRYVILLITCWC